MTETIIVAIITGGLSLLGVIITSNKTTREVQAKLDKQQAVTDTKLEELTREVREHNNFRSAAVKINVRGEVFVASAGVEVDDVVAAANDVLLKKRRELFCVRAAGAAGKNAVEVFAVGGKNVRAAAYEPVVIEGVHKVQLASDALRLKLAGKLDDSLNADVFAAVNSRRDRHARTLVRTVNDGFGVLQPRSGHGNEAADLFAFSHTILSP